MNKTVYISTASLKLGFLFVLLGFQTVEAQTYRPYNERGTHNHSHKQDINNLKQKAIDLFNRTVRQDPQSGTYYNNRANAHFIDGNYGMAIRDYGKALTYFRNNRQMSAKVYYQRGMCEYILRHFHEAVQDFNSAIAARPEVSDAYYFRAKIYHTAFKRAYQARADFERVLRSSGQNTIQRAYSHYFLGNAYEGERMMNKLLTESRRKGDQEFANVSYNMAGLQALMGNNKDALFHLDIAVKNGFSEFEWLKRDMNFDNIRYDEGFQELINSGSYNEPYTQNDSRPNPTPNSRPNNKPNTKPTPAPSGNGRPAAPAWLTISDLAYSDANQNNRIDAGEKSHIVFILKNEGSGRAKNMELRIEELNGLNGLGYTQNKVLGDLEAGERKEIRIELIGGNDLSGEEAEFKISVVEQNGFDAQEVQIAIPTFVAAPPLLSIADFHFTSEAGGKARRGVPMILKLAVQNQGQGVAQDVSLALSYPTDVFAAGDEKFSLGDLQPGESKIIDFEFFTNRRYAQDEVPITATLTESTGRNSLSKNMTLKMDQDLEVDARVVIKADHGSAVNIQDIHLLSDVDENLPRTSMSNPNAIAIIIGNRDYTKQDVPAVDFALQDALSMKKYLVNSMGYDENNIMFLANATQADFNGTFGTSSDHRARLFNLVKSGQSDVFIYYSGHGAPDLEGKEGYFVPVDCDPSLVQFNGYATSTFYKNLAKIPYRSLTVVIDACFSGASDQGTLLPQTSLARIKTKTGILNDPNAILLTSATNDQVASWYPEQHHSLFTYYYLKALQGAANTDKDGELTLGELKTYLQDKVPYMARRLRNRLQDPEVHGRESQVILKY